MVEENPIALLHRTQVVARLIIAHSCPRGAPILYEAGPGVVCWLLLHEPVLHETHVECGREMPELDPCGTTPQLVGIGAVAGGGVAFERQDVLVDGVNDVHREGEEGVFDFVGRGDPVARADDYGRGGRKSVAYGKRTDV